MVFLSYKEYNLTWFSSMLIQDWKKKDEIRFEFLLKYICKRKKKFSVRVFYICWNKMLGFALVKLHCENIMARESFFSPNKRYSIQDCMTYPCADVSWIRKIRCCSCKNKGTKCKLIFSYFTQEWKIELI